MAHVQPSRRTGSARSRGSKPRQVKCVLCPTIIDNSTKAMNCDACDNWLCLPCAKISQALYDELAKASDDGTSSLSWHCSACKNLTSSLKSINSNLLELKKSNDERLTRVESKISNLETTMKDTVRSEVDSAKEELNQVVQNNLAETVSNLVDSRLKEMENRKTRAQNLVFFHVPLSDASNPRERKEHDLEFVKKIFMQLFPGEDFLITTCFRLGRIKPDSVPTKDIPLKIVCDSREQRRKLLSKSKDITEIDDPLLCKVIVVKDLTEEQRTVNRQLRQEKSARKKNGENVRVRHGQVVEDTTTEAPSDK